MRVSTELIEELKASPLFSQVKYYSPALYDFVFDFVLIGTNFIFRVGIGVPKWKSINLWNVPFNPEHEYSHTGSLITSWSNVSFEEVLNACPLEIQNQLLFHLDLMVNTDVERLD